LLGITSFLTTGGCSFVVLIIGLGFVGVTVFTMAGGVGVGVGFGLGVIFVTTGFGLPVLAIVLLKSVLLTCSILLLKLVIPFPQSPS
jgi:hypothetical protein